MICNLLNCKIYNLDGQAVYFETRYISEMRPRENANIMGAQPIVYIYIYIYIYIYNNIQFTNISTDVEKEKKKARER